MSTLQALARRVSLFSVSLLPVACAGVDMASLQTREVVVELFEAFNVHDLEGVMAHYDPSVVKITPDHPTARRGDRVVREIYSGIFRAMPDVHDTVERVVVEGEFAAVEFTASWSAPDENGAIQIRTARLAAFLTIRDGKIVEDVTYYDRGELAGAD